MFQGQLQWIMHKLFFLCQIARSQSFYWFHVKKLLTFGNSLSKVLYVKPIGPQSACILSLDCFRIGMPLKSTFWFLLDMVVRGDHYWKKIEVTECLPTFLREIESLQISKITCKSKKASKKTCLLVKMWQIQKQKFRENNLITTEYIHNWSNVCFFVKSIAKHYTVWKLPKLQHYSAMMFSKNSVKLTVDSFHEKFSSGNDDFFTLWGGVDKSISCFCLLSRKIFSTFRNFSYFCKVLPSFFKKLEPSNGHY